MVYTRTPPSPDKDRIKNCLINEGDLSISLDFQNLHIILQKSEGRNAKDQFAYG